MAGSVQPGRAGARKGGTSAALREDLSALVGLLGGQLAGMHVAVFLLDEEAQRLRLAFSPTMPAAWHEILTDRPLVASDEPAMTAVARKEAAFVEDFSTLRASAHAQRQAGPRAAWSVPLMRGGTHILGALAAYGETPGLPTEVQRTALEAAAQVATVAVGGIRAEQLLQDHETHLRRIYDDVHDVLFSIAVRRNHEFVFTAANRRFFETTALPREQVIGRSVAQVIPEPSLSLVIGKYEQAIREKRTLQWEEVTPYPAGIKTGLVSVSPVLDAKGKCTRLVGSVHDITGRRQMEERLRRSEETFRLLFETSRDAIVVATPQGRPVRANRAAMRMFGFCDESQLLAQNPGFWLADRQMDGRQPGDLLEACLRDDVGRASPHVEWTCKRPDGSEFMAEATCVRMMLGEASFFNVTIRDISEKQAAQAMLARSAKLYAALSECNLAITKCTRERDLFEKVCRIAVEQGDMRLAWIGIHNPANDRLEPVAVQGPGSGYLERIEVSVDADKPTGRGPGGIAFREQHPVWCQDFECDPRLAAWRQLGHAFGLRSVAALPLFRKERVIGVFLLYSDTTSAFDGDARQLLAEMALDISFGLEMLQDAQERDVEQLQLRKLSQAVEQSQSMVMITDTVARIEYVNHAFERVTGYSRRDVIGRRPGFMQSPHTLPATLAEILARMAKGETWQGELTSRKKDGSDFICSVHLSPLRASDGQMSNYVGVGHDITEHRHTERRVEYLANFDDLTALPNRAQLNQHFGYALNFAKRNHQHMALMFCDLDHFKNINDTVGHGVGDEVLKEVARRLRSTLREEHVVARLGGDEFIVLLPGDDASRAADIARQLLSTFSLPCFVAGQDFTVTASIGIAVYPEDGADLETLSKNADMAMYRAKEDGRACYRFYTEEMQVRTNRAAQITAGLRQAIACDGFTIHYQPQFSGGRLFGAEALLRWHHPTLEEVSPSEFIPVAEESGLIFALGTWVLGKAVRQVKAWSDAGIRPLTVAVNVSPVQFRDTRFFDTVIQTLETSGLPSSSLELELTEGAAMHDPERAVEILEDLHRLGVSVAIDDFGIGHSSLNYLRRFKLHRLKIDQSFVRRIATSPEDRAIISTIIGMTRHLGLAVIAEGVETREQFEFLQEKGCDAMQGYLFSRPLPPEEFVRYWHARAADQEVLTVA